MPVPSALLVLIAEAQAAGYAISVAENANREDRLVLTFDDQRAHLTPAQAACFLRSILRESKTAGLRSL